jgi:hypothetical protein
VPALREELVLGIVAAGLAACCGYYYVVERVHRQERWLPSKTLTEVSDNASKSSPSAWASYREWAFHTSTLICHGDGRLWRVRVADQAPENGAELQPDR